MIVAQISEIVSDSNAEDIAMDNHVFLGSVDGISSDDEFPRAESV